MIDLQIPLPYRKDDVEFILNNYKNVTMTVTDMAKKFNVTPRTIQRLVKKHGIVRTIEQANKVTAKLKNYDALRIPDHLKSKRNILKKSLRFKLISEHPFCSTCGNTKEQCPLQVDHIDGNPSNNELTNLQVLCMLCNQGKR
jgi:hypothetical protein